jgi:hypothetical protein
MILKLQQRTLDRQQFMMGTFFFFLNIWYSQRLQYKAFFFFAPTFPSRRERRSRITKERTKKKQITLMIDDRIALHRKRARGKAAPPLHLVAHLFTLTVLTSSSLFVLGTTNRLITVHEDQKLDTLKTKHTLFVCQYIPGFRESLLYK